jgi:uncharacterized protein YbaR (Trm112 family)
MKVANEIQKMEITDEFHICPVCQYGLGFHSSFHKKEGNTATVILICPNCGARFDIGMSVDRL